MNNTEAQDAAASRAYIAGRQAGNLGLSPSLNEFPDGSAEHGEWERGRRSTANERASRLANQHRPCNYQRGHTCDCGGIGRCLDVA